MGYFRFRRSIKIAPGIKLNFNKKSVGMTVGTKGAHYSINSKGQRTKSIGIPGTGLSYIERDKINSGRNNKNASKNSYENIRSEEHFRENKAARHANKTAGKKLAFKIFGIIFIVFGALCIIGSLVPPISVGMLICSILIVLCGIMLIRSVFQKHSEQEVATTPEHIDPKSDVDVETPDNTNEGLSGNIYEIENSIAIDNAPSISFSNVFSQLEKTYSFNISSDIMDLLWIGSGKFCNYHKTNNSRYFSMNGYTVKMSFSSNEEPSLIYPELEISMPNVSDIIERPPYYPRYSDLNPKQRGMYLRFLSNPYDPHNDIGYVFIYYYGLERHKKEPKRAKYYYEILRLRKVYSNRSFQSYSSTTMLMFCMAKKKLDFANKFLETIEKEHDLTLPIDLYLLFKYAFDMPLTANELMRFHKNFGFDNNRYIKNNTEIYLENLQKIILQKESGNSIQLNSYLNNIDFGKLGFGTALGFANPSINNRNIPFPKITEYSNFKESMFALLKEAHETTKRQLAEQRKAQNKKLKTRYKTQTVIDSTDEIRKFKGLLDEGIITQEEFDAKKKELLGL